jgi:hypothetical protein
VLAEHGAQRSALPLPGIDLVQEDRDVVCVLLPARLLGLDPCLVAGLGRTDQIGGDEDVLAELGGERVAGGLSVEGLDRVADLGLVAEQARDRRLGVRRARSRGPPRARASSSSA